LLATQPFLVVALAKSDGQYSDETSLGLSKREDREIMMGEKELDFPEVKR